MVAATASEPSPSTGGGSSAGGTRRRRNLVFAATAGLASSGRLALAEHVEGSVSLAPRQAQVVTKFCFDFQKDCTLGNCPDDKIPGSLDFFAYGARRTDGLKSATKPEPEVYLALLDDEYFSFPEVSQVWGEANCSEVRHAAKQSFPLPWGQLSSVAGSKRLTHVVEHLRPRWWYIAIVSCAPAGVELSYRIHMSNPLQGWQQELSMDAVGIIWEAVLLCTFLVLVTAVQFSSAWHWSALGGPGGDVDPDSKHGRYKRFMHLHPALLMLTLATVIALLAEVAWFMHFLELQRGGAPREPWSFVGRALRATAKTFVSMLLLLLAKGQCVCTPDIALDENREVLLGLTAFGCLSFWLECWGDSELRTTSTEYIYDTRPGMVLVAFDLLWLWLYVSRAVSTWQAETRIKPRAFYRLYGFPLSIWFASMPLLAFLAAQLAPWVRFKVTYGVAGVLHVFVLAVLVHTFRPSISNCLYEISAHEYQPVFHEELDQMIGDDDFI